MTRRRLYDAASAQDDAHAEREAAAKAQRKVATPTPPKKPTGPWVLKADKYLRPEEQTDLLRHLDDAATLALARGLRLAVLSRAVFTTALASGLRASELCGVLVADLALPRTGPPTLFVRRGKGGRTRTVPLPSALRPMLAEYLRWLRDAGLPHGPDAALFPADDGQPLTRSGLWRRWAAALDAAGLPHRPLHGTRHCAGINAYRASKDLLAVKALLGHRKVATTEVYAVALPEDVAAMQDAAWGAVDCPRQIR